MHEVERPFDLLPLVVGLLDDECLAVDECAEALRLARSDPSVAPSALSRAEQLLVVYDAQLEEWATRPSGRAAGLARLGRALARLRHSLSELRLLTTAPFDGAAKGGDTTTSPKRARSVATTPPGSPLPADSRHHGLDSNAAASAMNVNPTAWFHGNDSLW